MKVAVVLTTVNVPTMLKDYADNFLKYGRHDIGFIVIGDVATPHEKARRVVRDISDQGFEAEYCDISLQKKWLRDFPKISKMIPYRTDNRRNIGFLMAVEQAAQTIISIDDDNHVTQEDYLKYHCIVGKTVTAKTVFSSNGWFNPCTLLQTDHAKIIHPRGYPFSRRHGERYLTRETTGKIAMNMGLWLNDPDVDAVTHLANPTRILGMKKDANHVMLAPGTYCPINTQNTAFHKNVTPCYYYVTMNVNIGGLKLDRYGDIWSGLFAKKAIDKIDERVTVGKPLTNHKRNPHDYLKDLKHELWGMILTEKLVDWLEQFQLESSGYSDVYLEMAEGLQKFKRSFQESTIRKYFDKVSLAMNAWVEACGKIL